MLGNARAYSGFAVPDPEKAKRFYGATLGLDVSDSPAGLTINLPGGQEVLVYEKPDFTPATYTMLNFEVQDVEAVVDQLNAQGVEMEKYEGFDQDDTGIVRSPEFPVGAWFTDPAGNIILVHEPFGD